MHFSNLTKIIETKEKKYLYDSISNTLLSLSKIDKKEGFKEIKDCNRFKEFTIKYPYCDTELSYMINNQMTGITLALTEQCNLRCQYCAYMPKYLKMPCELKEMDETIALRSIDMLMNCSKDSKYIFVDFYGGEPLLKFDLIERCVEYCKEKYPFRAPYFQITTNGVLLEQDKIVKFLVKNNFYLNLSLDGSKNVQDKYRVSLDGKPTFEVIFNNIIKLYKYSPKYFKKNVIFNSVITPTTGTTEQFDFLEGLWKSEIFLIEAQLTEYFSNLINSRKKIGLENLYSIKEHSIFNKSILKNMQKYHIALNNPGENLDFLPGGFCIPGMRRNFITVDGKIVVCEKVNEDEETFQIGNIYSGVDINKVKRLINKTIEKTQKCKICWAAKFCNLCFKDIFEISDKFCEKSRARIEKDLIKYLENIKPNKKFTSYLENLSVE